MTSRLDQLHEVAELARQSAHEAPPEKRGPLLAQWRAVLAEIEDLDDSSKAGDSVDEIAARRAARGGATARPDQAARGAG